MKENKIWVGYYRGWSTKTAKEKTQAYKEEEEEEGDDYREGKKTKPKTIVRLKLKITPEQMVRELQGVFCTGRYRLWMPSPTGSKQRGA
jgi:hypothetical protein